MWGEGIACQELAERGHHSRLPFGTETHLDKSPWLFAIRSFLPSDLMAKRSTGHMFTPFGEKYTEPRKQALHWWEIFYQASSVFILNVQKTSCHFSSPWEQITARIKPAFLKQWSKYKQPVSSSHVPFYPSFGWLKSETGKKKYYRIKTLNIIWLGHQKGH